MVLLRGRAVGSRANRSTALDRPTDLDPRLSRYAVQSFQRRLTFGSRKGGSALSRSNALFGWRHMTKGQRAWSRYDALAVAMIYPVGGSGKGANPRNLGFTGEYLRMARTVGLRLRNIHVPFMSCFGYPLR